MAKPTKRAGDVHAEARYNVFMKPSLADSKPAGQESQAGSLPIFPAFFPGLGNVF